MQFVYSSNFWFLPGAFLWIVRYENCDDVKCRNPVNGLEVMFLEQSLEVGALGVFCPITHDETGFIVPYSNDHFGLGSLVTFFTPTRVRSSVTWAEDYWPFFSPLKGRGQNLFWNWQSYFSAYILILIIILAYWI